MCHSDKEALRKKLSEIRKQVNEQRKSLDLNTLTTDHVVEALVDGFLEGMSGFLGGIYFNESQLKELKKKASNNI